HYSLAPYAVTQLKIGGLCLDGTNADALTATTCSGAASQNWYHLWGQIRNVENGLCMDAPNADGSSDTDSTVQVQLSPCNVFPPSSTMLWILLGDKTLQNGESANCIHLDSNNNILLGTGMCGDNDALGDSPKVFSGVESFVSHLPSASTPCSASTAVVRKDIRDLSFDVERPAFFNALNTLRKIPSLMGRPNRYIDYVSLHGITAGWIHRTPHFLSWHRYFLAILEADLRKILNNDKFAFPYWAWGASASNWYDPNVGVLNSTMLGTSGTGQSNCVNDGFMQGNWIPSDGLGCLIRSYTPSSAAGTKISLYPEDYLLLVSRQNPQTKAKYTSFDEFRRVVESSPHDNYHMAIAGNDQNAHMGNPAVSVNDPVFWLHHANIDRYWKYWQHANPNLANTYNGGRYFPPHNRNNQVPVQTSDILVGFNVPVSAGMGYFVPGRDSTDNNGFCHIYAPYSKSLAQVIQNETPLSRRQFSRRNNVNNNAHSVEHLAKVPVPPRFLPTPLSNEFLSTPWMRKMNVNVTEIREIEKSSFEVLQTLWHETDLAMKALFNADHSTITFDKFAISVSTAITKIVESL
ncbi:hypothetical protein HDU76_003318, partial [Blyttiomyces sp. JEL0837]